MSWLPLTAIALIALWAAYRAGQDKVHAEGIVAGVLIAQAADEPTDPISELVARQREAAERGTQ